MPTIHELAAEVHSVKVTLQGSLPPDPGNPGVLPLLMGMKEQLDKLVPKVEAQEQATGKAAIGAWRFVAAIVVTSILTASIAVVGGALAIAQPRPVQGAPR